MKNDNVDTNQEPVDGTANTKLNYHRIAQLVAVFVTCIGPFVGNLLPRLMVIFLVAVLAGGFLWKIPPFEVGPRPGLHNGFPLAVYKRAKSACLMTATWGGVGAVFGVFVGAIIGGLVLPGSFLDSAGYGATWGTLAFGLIGAAVWTGTRVIDDAKYLQIHPRAS